MCIRIRLLEFASYVILYSARWYYAGNRRFYGLVIKMIFNDNDRHHKPHVHVYYGEYEASVALDGEVLEGKIPVKQYRMLAGWMAIHEEELYEAWNQAVRNIPFSRIEPLK